MRHPWPAEGLVARGIALRRWRPADLEQRLAIDDAEAQRWSPPGDRRSEVIRAQIEAEATAEPVTRWAIADAASLATVLGSIDVRRGPPPPFSFCDVGYVVAAPARGRGVATAALDLLAGWLLDPVGADLDRVQLDHAVQNVASCRTALRAGFAQEGTRARYLPLRAGPSAPIVLHDVCLHGRVRPAP